MPTLLRVRHNIEVAHRLSQLPGKCEAIHGHSMWITLDLAAPIDTHGLAGSMDFSVIKALFRGHLDSEYDHRLLLNQDDPIAYTDLPGLRRCPADPTTENIAAWIGHWATETYHRANAVRVTVDETHANAAMWTSGELT